jgi:hypothetical protein
MFATVNLKITAVLRRYISVYYDLFYEESAHEKIMIVTIVGSKANEYINIFLIATFFEFLAALNTMVADENSVRR